MNIKNILQNINKYSIIITAIRCKIWFFVKGDIKMKTVLVYCHPYNGSFCHAILESAKKAAIKAGQEVDVIDLYADKFNPVMSAEDLKAFVNHEMVDPQAKDYFNRIKNADHMVLIFPIWWETMPAMMKGFIDKIMFPGSFYDMSAGGSTAIKTRLPNLKITVITTMNTPASVYRLVYGNAIYKTLVKGTFKFIGNKDVQWVSFNMVKDSTEEQRKQWLEKVAQIVAGKKN